MRYECYRDNYPTKSQCINTFVCRRTAFEKLAGKYNVISRNVLIFGAICEAYGRDLVNNIIFLDFSQKRVR